MTSSNGNIFRVTGPLCGEFTGHGEFPTQRPVTRSFDVFFDLRLRKRLSKQPWGWWFETPSWSLWRQCNDRALNHLLNLLQLCLFPKYAWLTPLTLHHRDVTRVPWSFRKRNYRWLRNSPQRVPASNAEYVLMQWRHHLSLIITWPVSKIRIINTIYVKGMQIIFVVFCPELFTLAPQSLSLD